ncbi:MAG: glycerate kinase [Chloroflexi bacterium]|nr:glycerate kinase [Chloroflexota bacterium]
MSAVAAADAIARGLRASPLDDAVDLLPIADGGNGTVDAFLVHGGRRETRRVTGPLGAPVDADFALLPDGRTAVIEMALASGLELVDQLDAGRASTHGTGELIRAALDAGVSRLIVGVGGSATTDGGAGCLMALGLSVAQADGAEIGSGGISLHNAAQIDTTGLDPRLPNVEVIVATDVDNPATGPEGAAVVFGPQKGADAQLVESLDAALSRWFSLATSVTGRDVTHEPGAGAAGALAGGLLAFANAKLVSGVDLLLDYAQFDQRVQSHRLVITGEGRLDDQSLRGKGPIGVARRAQGFGVPTLAFAGSVTANPAALRDAGIAAAFPIVDRIITLSEALNHGPTLLETAAFRVGCTIALARAIS